MEPTLNQALARFDRINVILPPVNAAYRLPVVRLKMPYRKVRKNARRGETVVNFRGKARTITETTRVLLKERGFTVMRAFEVNTFIRDFLVAEPRMFGGPFTDFLGWVTQNGYSKAEVLELQWRHKSLLRRYCAGDDRLFVPLLENAVELATRYYIARRNTKRKTLPLRKSTQPLTFQIILIKADSREKRLYDKKKTLFLETLAKDFFRTSLSVKERRAIVDAYRQRPLRMGDPSLFAFHPKKKIWFFVSVKSNKGALSPQQHDWIEFIQRHFGERAFLLRIVP